MHPNFLFGIASSNEISVPYLSVYEAANAYGFYHGNSIYKEYKDEFDILNTPTSKSQQQELEYRNLRESKINFIEFINNEVEGLVYDFKIGVKKVQEKVGSITKNNPNSFLFNLIKYKCRVEGKCVNQSYQEGDNDLYWLHCKNRKFYVIPEKELIEHGYIGKHCKEH